MSEEPLFTEIYREKICEPAQSSHFMRKFTGKMPQTKTALHTLCQPARSKRNETHVKMSEELQEKCRRPE
jgi:hypothetical protein